MKMQMWRIMMRTQLRNGRKWSLYGAVFTAMIYSVLTLHSEPAYAGTCTASFCTNTAPTDCRDFCLAHNYGPYEAVRCTTGSTAWDCICLERQTAIPCP
jgi:hypothetical protein